MRVSSITESEGYDPKTKAIGVSPAKTVKLQCSYDTTIPEDQRFYDATPTGHIEMVVNNPVALEQLTIGKSFYVDFTPCE